jgi:hypothetical protein
MFSSAPEVIVRIVPWLGHDHFFPNPFQFFNHQEPCYPTLYNVDTNTSTNIRKRSVHFSKYRRNSAMSLWSAMSVFFVSFVREASCIAVSVMISVYRRADNSLPTVSLCYEPISSAERNNRESARERETSKRHVGEAHSVLITAILLPQRLSCYCGKIVSLRMLTNLRLADLRLTTGQNLPSDL